MRSAEVRTRAIRIVVVAVCALGIAGMIVASATNHNGAAITFGLITAVAVLCQMVATTVVNELRGAPGAEITAISGSVAAGKVAAGSEAVSDPGEGEAAALEGQITALVDAGADETAVRDLVRRAVRMGRGGAASAGPMQTGSSRLPQDPVVGPDS